MKHKETVDVDALEEEIERLKLELTTVRDNVLDEVHGELGGAELSNAQLAIARKFVIAMKGTK